MAGMQAVTVRLPDSLGNHFLVRATIFYEKIAQTAKFKSKVSLPQFFTQVANHLHIPTFLANFGRIITAQSSFVSHAT